MEARPVALLLFWGPLLSWNLISAETKGFGDDAKTKPRSPSPSEPEEDPVKSNREWFTSPPGRPGAEAPASDHGHLIAGVLIGVILVAMIVVTVSIFLWRRCRRASSPLPHWAGRSPFADGDVPDVNADKEAAQGPKRVSVLSLLPWKLHKETELSGGNAVGASPDSQQNLDLALPPGSQEAESCTTTTATTTRNSDSSASTQTPLSEEPCGLMDVPLQPHLPPPPSWLGETNGGLGPDPSESSCPPPIADTQGSAPRDLSCPTPGETLPPPPEDLLYPTDSEEVGGQP